MSKSSTKRFSMSPRSTVLQDDSRVEPYMWDWDLKRDYFLWAGNFSQLHATDASEIPLGIETFLSLLHPEDRAMVRREFESSASVHPVERDLRLMTGAPAHMRAVPVCNRSGELVRLLGLCSSARPARSDEWLYTVSLLLAQAEQTAGFGTWVFDIQSGFGSLSPHLADLLGFAPRQCLSVEEYWSRLHADDRTRVIQRIKIATARSAPFQFIARYLAPSGNIRHHLVRGIPCGWANGRVNSICGITFDFSNESELEGELQRLSQKLLRTRDDERRTIARELHESTGQTLAAVKMSLGRLREALASSDPKLRTLLSSTIDLTEEAIREIRTLSYLMHPPMLDEAGLRSALHWYVKGFAERSGISVRVEVPDDLGRFGQHIETTIFRIVQEALTNVHRYSGSRTATVHLTRRNGFVWLIVQDQGCGLASTSTKRHQAIPGVGIVGMRERVKHLNGTFELESIPGKGTSVRVALPANHSGILRRCC